MNTCRGIAALVLGVLELNWEMLAAGIMCLSLSSHLPLPFTAFLSVLSPFFSKSKSDWEENYTKSKQPGQSIQIKESLISLVLSSPPDAGGEAELTLVTSPGLVWCCGCCQSPPPVTPSRCESLRAAAGREVALMRRAGGGWGFWV